MWRDVRRGGRRCAGIVNVMLMVLMGSRCHTSGMRIQSHAGVTLLPVYMPRVRTLQARSPTVWPPWTERATSCSSCHFTSSLRPPRRSPNLFLFSENIVKSVRFEEKKKKRKKMLTKTYLTPAKLVPLREEISKQFIVYNWLKIQSSKLGASFVGVINKLLKI